MKIQYKSQPFDTKSERRYLFYRIVPSELSWWKRTFKNPWIRVYTAYSIIVSTDNSVHDCLRFLFSAEEANKIASKYDTYEKITDFLNTEFHKAETRWNKTQKKFVNQNKNWNF